MHWCISDSALLVTLSTEPIEWIKIETDKRGTSVVTPEPGGAAQRAAGVGPVGHRSGPKLGLSRIAPARNVFPNSGS